MESNERNRGEQEDKTIPEEIKTFFFGISLRIYPQGRKIKTKKANGLATPTTQQSNKSLPKVVKNHYSLRTAELAVNQNYQINRNNTRIIMAGREKRHKD